MISLVRKSTKYLIIETYDLAAMEDYLITSLKAFKDNIYTVSAKTNEDYTVIYITDDINKPSVISEESPVYMLPQDLDHILCRIVNEKNNHLIKSLKLAPRLLIFRYFGNISKIIYSILKDYEGEIRDLKETFFNLDLPSSVITFTDKPLINNLGLDDLCEKCIVIGHPTKGLYRNLKVNALRYLNEGLENKNWYEVEIRIYDIYNAYHLHYRRLMHVLENLELGLVLGESWSKDYAVLLMSVGVYSIRFFTLYEPKHIKKILLGLEISSDNTRICDYDVYHGRKKISWIDFAQNRKEVRTDVAKRCREELFKMLSPSSIEYMKNIEKEIMKSRE
ncbi:hypothetical protein [Lutispora saccharofermentans]|uniref:Uncharacterized protein n=1 Tax=Lutispora saccharofermentans TaxID=3024236 RepID=A0ABT1NH25_9FIRM|nr:hypothetical protein [Lutispora saccharofermentans]MCQ1530560.1 hypothetical protein [Lutispora saccharofermentans]